MRKPSRLRARICLLGAVAGLYAVAPASNAAEHRIDCPQELPQESVQIVSPPTGWTPHVPTGLRLHSAGLMFGPPSRMAISKPDSYKAQRGKSTEKWVELSGSIPGGKWIACNYGAGNDVILSKRIDDNTSECTVTYTKDKQGGDIIDVRCTW